MLAAVARRSLTTSARERRSERRSNSQSFEYSPGSMITPARGDLWIIWRLPPPVAVVSTTAPLTCGSHARQLHPSRTAPVRSTSSTSVAHSTPPVHGALVVSRSLADTRQPRPPDIRPSPRLSGPPTGTTRAARAAAPPDRDVPNRPHVEHPDSYARPHIVCLTFATPAPARSGDSDPACPVADRPVSALYTRPAPAHAAHVRLTAALPTLGRPTHGRPSVIYPVVLRRT